MIQSNGVLELPEEEKTNRHVHTMRTAHTGLEERWMSDDAASSSHAAGILETTQNVCDNKTDCCYQRHDANSK